MNETAINTVAGDRSSTPEAMQSAAPVSEALSQGSIPETSATVETDLRWIMREACWSRMFGKAASQNPFTK
jgi:hypothetical protein